jgi:hypothetical protein
MKDLETALKLIKDLTFIHCDTSPPPVIEKLVVQFMELLKNAEGARLRNSQVIASITLPPQQATSSSHVSSHPPAVGYPTFQGLMQPPISMGNSYPEYIPLSGNSNLPSMDQTLVHNASPHYYFPV